MVNIKTINYRIRFLQDISFKESPEIAFFKAIYRRLKNIICIKSNEDCKICSHRPKCLYSYLSAEDFQHISSMPVIIKRPLFTKKTIQADELIDLKITFLGDAAKHMDFFNYILKEFEVRGLFRERYKFIIVNRKIEELDKVNKESQISSIKILTPIERKDQIFTAEKEKLDKLNELYHITDKPIESIETPYDFHAVRFKINNPIYIGVNKLIQEGYVGTIKFVEPITKTYLLDLISLIGAGQLYSIGGGATKVIY
ncbi:MAG: hypothetical protein GX021_10655 [Tissierellia bacterium]|nr:hypothetical protein [Tissierellia bacterium]